MLPVHCCTQLKRQQPQPRASLLPAAPAVSRIKARSDLYEMDLILDVNVDVFPGGQREG